MRPGVRTSEDSCIPASYTAPEVEIGALARAAPLVRASMVRQIPVADTPTSAALQGAIDHARAWAPDPAHAFLQALNIRGKAIGCR